MLKGKEVMLKQEISCGDFVLEKGARKVIAPLAGHILSKLKTEKVGHRYKAND
jgi:hypothetical protein